MFRRGRQIRTKPGQILYFCVFGWAAGGDETRWRVKWTTLCRSWLLSGRDANVAPLVHLRDSSNIAWSELRKHWEKDSAKYDSVGTNRCMCSSYTFALMLAPTISIYLSSAIPSSQCLL